MTDLPAIQRFEDWAFERCSEDLRRIVAACRGLDCVLHTDGPEICTPPTMSPALFGRLVTPYLRKLAEIIHDGGLLCGIHCHGHVREIFPEMLKTGADLLEPIEPPDQGNIKLAELMQQAEGRISLMGYLQDRDFYTAPPGADDAQGRGDRARRQRADRVHPVADRHAVRAALPGNLRAQLHGMARRGGSDF